MLHDLGHGKRYWDEVSVGDKLPTRVFGPHSIASFTTEWRAYLFTIWCGVIRRTDLDMEALGFTEDMAGKEQDPVLEKENPELTDGAYIGPSRGHLFPRWARYVGMPRTYGYGASMGAWILDYLGGWAGEWGQVVHSNCAYRGPAFTGDITIMNAEVTASSSTSRAATMVQVDCRMTQPARHRDVDGQGGNRTAEEVAGHCAGPGRERGPRDLQQDREETAWVRFPARSPWSPAPVAASARESRSRWRAKGATVYVTGRTVTPGSSAVAGHRRRDRRAVRQRGGKGIAVQVDHGKDEQVAALFARVRARAGPARHPGQQCILAVGRPDRSRSRSGRSRSPTGR